MGKHTEKFGNEQELWLSFKNGSRAALKVIFKRYYPELYAYGLKLVFNPDVVRDNIQELFIKTSRNPIALHNTPF